MPRIWTSATVGIIGLLLLSTVPVSAQITYNSERLLPATTEGFLAVPDVELLRDRWNATQIGQLMADPVMKPFADDLRRQFEDRFSGMRERMGFALEDLRDIAGGEVAVAMIRPAPGEAAMAILVDVTDHMDNAAKLLEQVAANLMKRKAKQDRQMIDGVPVIIFDVPPPAEEPDLGTQRVVYFLAENLLGASNSLEEIEGILARRKTPSDDHLATVEAFQKVMNRCAADNDNQLPLIRWYVHPLGYVETIRTTTPETRRRKGKPVLELLENQGFEAVLGVGGFVDFAVDEYQMIHRVSVHAPPPYRMAMKMFSLPNHDDFTPPSWVPRDVATYSTIYCDILNAFDNFGPLFDELFGGEVFLFTVPQKFEADLAEGKLSAELRQEFDEVGLTLGDQAELITRKAGSVWKIKYENATYVIRKKTDVLRIYEEPTGIWLEVLASIKEDPNGPQVDLRKELITHLGQRVTVIGDNQPPVTTTSERLLFAIETTNPEALAETIRKMMEADPTAERRVIDNQVIWEMVEEVEADLPSVDIQLPSFDPTAPDQGVEEEPEEEEQRLLPHAAVTVAHGHLLVASHLDFMKKILAERQDARDVGQDARLPADRGDDRQLEARQVCADVLPHRRGIPPDLRADPPGQDAD